MYLNVQDDTINNNVKNIESSLEYLNDDIKKVSNIVLDIGNIWHGSDHDFFDSKMEEFLEQMVMFKDSLDSYKNFVKTYIEVLNDMDDAYQNKRIELK